MKTFFILYGKSKATVNVDYACKRVKTKTERTQQWFAHVPKWYIARSVNDTAWGEVNDWNRAVFNWVSKVTELLWFCLTTLYDWFKKTRATSINQMQKRNQSRLGRTRFPALGAGYVYFLRVLIGSLCVYVCCDWPLKLLWFWFYDTQLKTAL